MRMILASDPGGDGLGDRVSIRRATQCCDDLTGGVAGDLLHALRGMGLDFRDPGLGFGSFRSDFRVGPGDGFVELGLNLRARFGSNRLRLGAGIGKRLFIGGFGIRGLTLQVFGGGEIVGDGSLAFGQNSRDSLALLHLHYKQCIFL